MLRKKIRKYFPRKAAKFILKHYLRIHKVVHNRIVAYFGEIYFQGYHPIVSLSNRSKFLIDNLSNDDIVLDIACGNGMHLQNIADKIRKGIGIDHSKHSVDLANTNNKNTNIQFIQSDIFIFDYRNLKKKYNYNVAIFSHFLEHIEDVPSLLKLVNAEKNLIIVPSQEKWEVKLLKYLGLNYFSDPSHYREYTQDMLIAEITQSGFSIQYIGYNADSDIVCSVIKSTK